jgi:hypothetical protein
MTIESKIRELEEELQRLKSDLSDKRTTATVTISDEDSDKDYDSDDSDFDKNNKKNKNKNNARSDNPPEVNVVKNDHPVERVVIKYDDEKYKSVPFALRDLQKPKNRFGNNFLDACYYNVPDIVDAQKKVIFDYQMLKSYFQMCEDMKEFSEIEYIIDPNLCFDACYSETIGSYITTKCQSRYITFTKFLEIFKEECEKSYADKWQQCITFVPNGFRVRTPIYKLD